MSVCSTYHPRAIETCSRFTQAGHLEKTEPAIPARGQCIQGEIMFPKNSPSPAGQYSDAHLFIDFVRETVLLDGAPVELTCKSFCLLGFLVRHSGELVPREALLQAIWGYGTGIRTRTLDVHIRRLRKHLGCYANTYIETIFGVGYRFQPCRTRASHEIAQTASSPLAPEAPSRIGLRASAFVGKNAYSTGPSSA
jgi:DNA-binding winged helix-turn-helix (wHTH) protein